MAELVVGVDGTKHGLVAVVLAGDRFLEARLIDGVETSFAEVADVSRIAIDVPIGYGPRKADGLARALVGGSSVFSIPERERFEVPLAEGGGHARELHRKLAQQLASHLDGDRVVAEGPGAGP